MRVPIACSLEASAARSQIDEWRTAIALSVTGVERPSPTMLAMTLRADLAGLTDLVQLAQREQACCPFFDFDLAIEADRIRLLVSVPDEAASVLDQFGVLAVGEPRPPTCP